jgi:hypothetical protein
MQAKANSSVAIKIDSAHESAQGSGYMLNELTYVNQNNIVF